MSHYVDNKQLFEVMVEFVIKCKKAKELNQPRPKVPDYVGLCVYQIANRLSFKPNFINYTFRDDMIGDGIENCLTYVHNFNPEKSNNPFAYFTQIIFYAFLRRIEKEKKQLYIKHKSIENNILEQNLYDTMSQDEYKDFMQMYSSLIPDNRIADLVNLFEPKKTAKNKKKGLEVFVDDEDK